ncbi:MAG: IS1595 family transposase [Halioglobus sp.]
MGENRGIVEVDETYVGGKPRHRNNPRAPYRAKAITKKSDKAIVMAMVERGGCVKTRPVADVTSNTLQLVMRENIDKSARSAPDQNLAYNGCHEYFVSGHSTVNHSAKEYVRGIVHTNTVEGFFSTVKRGLNGIYHSVSKEHLHRYMSEFEFRYNHRHMEDL